MNTLISAHLNIDPESFTLAGFSSGAAMASQFHVSHSSQVKGVALFAPGK